jgi:hypothetical protein
MAILTDVGTAENTTARGDRVGSAVDGRGQDADGREGQSDKSSEVHCDESV